MAHGGLTGELAADGDRFEAGIGPSSASETLGNFRQHITFAGTLGVICAWGASALAGLHWVYGTVAALLATLGGLLPDLDHPVGRELKGFTGILGVLTALAVWHRLARGVPDLPFELHLWAVVLAYIFVRYGLRKVLAKTMVHRGISHSFPTLAVWAAVAYLYYPSTSTLIRVLMAGAVALGFLSHLLLDEMFSVDLTGAKLKRSFGTAMKFWASSFPATLAIYLLLSYLSYRVIQEWPNETFAEILSEPVPAIEVPWPPSKWPEYRREMGRQGPMTSDFFSEPPAAPTPRSSVPTKLPRAKIDAGTSRAQGRRNSADSRTQNRRNSYNPSPDDSPDR